MQKKEKYKKLGQSGFETKRMNTATHCLKSILFVCIRYNRMGKCIDFYSNWIENMRKIATMTVYLQQCYISFSGRDDKLMPFFYLVMLF